MDKNSKFAQALIFIFIFPIAALMVLFLLLYTPIDLVRYRFSRHRKDMKHLYGKQAKYSWLATLTYYYNVYELISKNDLPIQYFRNPNMNLCTYGYFYANQTLFIVDVVPHFHPEGGNWSVVSENDESDVNVYMAFEKERFDTCMGFNENVKCERVVFLVKEKELHGEEKEMAEQADFILTYNKKNFAKKINEFLKYS